jgi:hypothetical protein
MCRTFVTTVDDVPRKAKITSMQTASLEILEQVAGPSPVARAIVQVFDIEFTEARKSLATKQDLIELRHSLQLDMANMQTRLIDKMDALKSDGTRQLYVALAAQTGLMLGAFYFFVVK